MKKYILFIIILLQACSVDSGLEYKSPSGLNVRMDLNAGPTKNGRLYFAGGEIVLSRFQLEGNRVQGDDYFFQNGYNPPISIPLDSTWVNPELQFDLPQGIYNRIEIQFEIPSANITTLRIEGSFQDSSGLWLPLRLEVDSFEAFEVLANNNEGLQEVVIDNEYGYTALIKLNPVHWFSGLSISDLEQAERSLIGGVSGIVISTDVNTVLYSEIDNRLDELNSLSIR